jgi:hypothetical protein
MMDLVINHTAKDAALVTDRPQWYVHSSAAMRRIRFQARCGNA